MRTMSRVKDLRASPREAIEEEVSDPLLEATPATRDAQDDEVCSDTLRADILRHIEELGLASTNGNGKAIVFSKEGIRAAHAYQRICYMEREARMLGRRWSRLMEHFAEGHEVDPGAIDPKLEVVESEKESGRLFRFATTLWSAPVSRGFGRRMRYLVRDRSNGKLIGIFALGDPVFNLKARDEWISWNQAHRRDYLTNVMDAYVVGAVPPYAQLLGGKLVASLIGSKEVAAHFHAKYRRTTGIISGKQKRAQLALVTVTSALGRSSIYNRLHLREPPFEVSSPTLVKLERIGETTGYGHFHLPDEIFARLRRLIAQDQHAYANGHQFGDGPNWRMRVARVGLQNLGLDPNLVRHGIRREVYAMPMTEDFRDVLKGNTRHTPTKRPSTRELSSAALGRWVLPRAEARPEFNNLRKRDYLAEHLNLLAERELPL
jgi:hypothetical protein